MRFKLAAFSLGLGSLVLLSACPSENQVHLQMFETVWRKIDDTYFDPAFGGLDWKDIHDRYLPLITSADGDEEFYRLVNEMLRELDVSHASLIPTTSLALYEPLAFAEGGPGLDIRLLDGAAVVTLVEPGSPAGRAGLRRGHVIWAIDDTPVDEIVREASLRLRPPFNSRSRIATITKVLLGRIYGPPGTDVSIVFSDETGNKEEAKITRIKRNGVSVGPGIFLATDFQAKRLDKRIGYFRANTLQPQFADRIYRAIRSMRDIQAVILDLRGNSGGEIEQMPELFLNESALLYRSRSRSGVKDVRFDAADDAFKGTLIILIDQLSGSASELLAAGLQAVGRAVVVGERSPGSVMEMDSQMIRNEALLIYPVAQLWTPNGTVLEGHGVVPDIEVGLDRDMLLKGIDSQLDAAFKYIEGAVP